MNVRKIGLWILWLGIGVVAVAVLVPELSVVRSVGGDKSTKITFSEIASALPGDTSANPGGPVATVPEYPSAMSSIPGLPADEAALDEVSEGSPADFGGKSDSEVDWSDVTGSVPDGVYGYSGPGPGGGGTGYGSIGIGDIGAVGKGSGAQPAQPKAERKSAAESFDLQLEEVDRKLASLPLGNIAFNTPDMVPMGETSAIELVVSLAETEEEIEAVIRAPGKVETARVQVSPYMEATLSGVGFRIESVTPAQQMLSRTQRTKWRWQIEPTRAESLELTLTLNALFTLDGDERQRVIRTFERVIEVDVPLTYQVTQFVGNNQEWLATVLVIPVLGALYRRFRKKKTEHKEPAESRRAA